MDSSNRTPKPFVAGISSYASRQGSIDQVPANGHQQHHYHHQQQHYNHNQQRQLHHNHHQQQVKSFNTSETISSPYRSTISPQTKLNQSQNDMQELANTMSHRPHPSGSCVTSLIKVGLHGSRSGSIGRLDTAINNLKNSSSNGYARQQSTSSRSNNILHSPSTVAITNSKNQINTTTNNITKVVSLAVPSHQSVPNTSCRSSSDLQFKNNIQTIVSKSTPPRPSSITNEINKSPSVDIKTAYCNNNTISDFTSKVVQTKDILLKPKSVTELTHTSSSSLQGISSSAGSSPASVPKANQYLPRRSFIKITPKRKYNSELNIPNVVKKVQSDTGLNSVQRPIQNISTPNSNGSDGERINYPPSTHTQDNGMETKEIPIINSDDGIIKTKELLDAADRASPKLIRSYNRSPAGTFTKVISTPANDSPKKAKVNSVDIPFVWDDYLEATGASAAPTECFKQNQNDIICKFEIGMKLETRDPRNPSAWCLATVIRKEGIRIQLRLDGSGNSNDFWQLIDSPDNRPVGSNKCGYDSLAPPVGFTSCCSSYPKWIEKRIAKPGVVIAPDNCFEPEPVKPPYNLFKKGMKIEAVDKKNTYLICPATIGEVNGSEISVCFDGWKGSFDYKCHYDSRDIFPVGWCSKTGYTLQKPGSWPAILSIVQKPAEANSSTLDDSELENFMKSLDVTKKKISSLNPIEESMKFDQNLVMNRDCQSTSSQIKKSTSPITESGARSETSSDMVERSIASNEKSDVPSSNELITGPSTFQRIKPMLARRTIPIKKKRGRPKSVHLIPKIKLPKIKRKFHSELPTSSNESSPLACEIPSKILTPNPAEGSQPCKMAKEQILIAHAGDPHVVTNEQQSSSIEQKQLCNEQIASDNQESNSSGFDDTKPKIQESLDIYGMSAEDVVEQILRKDDVLTRHVNVFLENEIDGKSFMLLNQECMAKDLGLKLGPILKIKFLQKELTGKKL